MGQATGGGLCLNRSPIGSNPAEVGNQLPNLFLEFDVFQHRSTLVLRSAPKCSEVLRSAPKCSRSGEGFDDGSDVVDGGAGVHEAEPQDRFAMPRCWHGEGQTGKKRMVAPGGVLRRIPTNSSEDHD
jgi:hypothetical protein